MGTEEQTDALAEEASLQAQQRNNRRVLAGRLKWPAGTLDVCEQLEESQPGWYVFWMRENTAVGSERPAGFSAVWRAYPQAKLFNPNPGELQQEMKLTRPT